MHLKSLLVFAALFAAVYGATTQVPTTDDVVTTEQVAIAIDIEDPADMTTIAPVTRQNKLTKDINREKRFTPGWFLAALAAKGIVKGAIIKGAIIKGALIKGAITKGIIIKDIIVLPYLFKNLAGKIGGNQDSSKQTPVENKFSVEELQSLAGLMQKTEPQQHAQQTFAETKYSMPAVQQEAIPVVQVEVAEPVAPFAQRRVSVQKVQPVVPDSVKVVEQRPEPIVQRKGAPTVETKMPAARIADPFEAVEAPIAQQKVVEVEMVKSATKM